jgi:transposase
MQVFGELLRGAAYILGRFHIVANMNKAVKSRAAHPIPRKSRWRLPRRSKNLGADQHFRLRDLLRYNLKTGRAYLLKEAFQQRWE